ncbi:hypothetical protein WQE_33121 [Paraburkholderia hospita]|uniref:Uncharacterized protein n=1 Tax=Paraburkholderia hospita TaxID=169430 RepID=A0ABN0FDE4_9BURK|nr:hypothetical protein WQE_33121 [Paraburkholderia hospita]OUL70871.1 hypothetical protein CA602_47530 [Paraburkholderia hospita]OUL74388.1 hypothetical protein CA601_42765 [Paraburkholderia hospita]
MLNELLAVITNFYGRQLHDTNAELAPRLRCTYTLARHGSDLNHWQPSAAAVRCTPQLPVNVRAFG